MCSQVEAETPVRCAKICAALEPWLPAVLPFDNVTEPALLVEVDEVWYEGADCFAGAE